MPGYIDKDALIKTTEEVPFTMSMCVSVDECIRQMDDYALAVLFANIISERDHFIIEQLRSADVSVELIEFPDASIQSHYDWLRQERKDGADNG